MLREEVVEAAARGEFHVWPVRTVAQGIELLTGCPAGERGPDGAYPPDTVFGLVDARLKALAEGMRDFAAAGEDEAGPKKEDTEGCGGGCPR